MIKTMVTFWRAGFYPANQNNLKCIPKALMAEKNPALQKRRFCFDHVNRLIMLYFICSLHWMWNFLCCNSRCL